MDRTGKPSSITCPADSDELSMRGIKSTVRQTVIVDSARESAMLTGE